MKGKKDHHAAAIEAREEAGLIGRVHQKPIGSYAYWKRRADRFEYVKVKVFVLEVRRQLIDWREKGQRRGVWLPIDDAAELVSEPGLVTIIDDLSATLATPTARAVLGKLPKKEVRKANAGATSVAAVNSVSGD
jgi:8-oxo-dGTP pyrophosphatase MutT (NUDIX family)